jgi:predicted nucleic acid-binding protein
MSFVLDTSVTMAWCFENEATPYSAHVLDLLEGDAAVAPSIWPLEVVNVIRNAERRQRLSPADAARFLGLVSGLDITVETTSLERAAGSVLDLARAHGLTSYDASFLDLAMREGLPLATLDARLRTAAEAAGVGMIP